MACGIRKRWPSRRHPERAVSKHIREIFCGKISAVRLPLAILAGFVLACHSRASETVPALTPGPNGPYRIEGNRILDRQGREYLIRGTRAAPLAPDRAVEKSSAAAFGPLSATVLITIRQRLNMNAVRIPINPTAYLASAAYRGRARRLVRLVNQLELLAIVEASEEGAGAGRPFWSMLATDFRGNRNLFLACRSGDLVRDIRRAGAMQPVIVSAGDAAARDIAASDPNVIYEVSPGYSAIQTDEDRRREFESAARAPLIVDGLDPQLDQASGECAAFPRDPGEATRLIEANLTYFDRQGISWTLSSFTEGKLITDYRFLNGTKLDSGWICGRPDQPAAGIGLVLLSHLWAANPLGLFPVSQSRGGLVLARGGVATAYGPILADREMAARGLVLPWRLGNVSVRITDALGVPRFAPLLYTGAGWSFINFIVPEKCAKGPAEVAVVRDDGSVSSSRVLIGDLAPGLLTVPPDGRSAAVGEVTQHAAGKPEVWFATWQCRKADCRTAPIALSPEVATTLRLTGTGFRHFGSHPVVEVTAGGISAPVVSIGPGSAPGTDQVTVRVPDTLAGRGETDLYMKVNGELSNVVRVNFGTMQHRGAAGKRYAPEISRTRIHLTAAHAARDGPQVLLRHSHLRPQLPGRMNRKIRIAQKLTRHQDHVGLPARDNLLRLRRLRDHPDRTRHYACFFPNPFRERHLESWPDRDLRAKRASAGRHIHQIHSQRRRAPRQFDRVVNRPSAVYPVGR